MLLWNPSKIGVQEALSVHNSLPRCFVVAYDSGTQWKQLQSGCEAGRRRRQRRAARALARICVICGFSPSIQSYCKNPKQKTHKKQSYGPSGRKVSDARLYHFLYSTQVQGFISSSSFMEMKPQTAALKTAEIFQSYDWKSSHKGKIPTSIRYP